MSLTKGKARWGVQTLFKRKRLAGNENDIFAFVLFGHPIVPSWCIFVESGSRGEVLRNE